MLDFLQNRIDFIVHKEKEIINVQRIKEKKIVKIIYGTRKLRKFI
jgi:hypothetical protein